MELNGAKILKSRCLYECDFRIFIDALLNFQAQVDTFVHQNHVSSPYRSNLRHFRLKYHIFCEFLMLLDVPLDYPARVDTHRH